MPERESVRANISAPISDRPIATSYEIICALERKAPRDRKSTRLNSSHLGISYAVFCLKKKKKRMNISQLDKSHTSLWLKQKNLNTQKGHHHTSEHTKGQQNLTAGSSRQSITVKRCEQN